MFTKILYQDLDNIFNNKIINWKKIHKKKILITGANGFIASYLISFLIFLNIKKKFNIKIFLITRNTKEIKKKIINNKTRNFVKILNINLNENLDISQKVNYIFHLASNASPKNYKKFPLNTLEPNVLGTFNLLSYASKIKIKSFIFLVQEKFTEIPKIIF